MAKVTQGEAFVKTSPVRAAPGCGLRALFALVCAAGAAKGADPATSELSNRSSPSQSSPSSDAQVLFRSKCGVCHLEGGTGTFMLSRRLGAQNALLESRSNLDPAMVKLVARNGLMSMPRFTRAELTDPQLQAIAQYLASANSQTAK